MTGYKMGMAEEAVIANLTAKLAECQAREEKLREALDRLARLGNGPHYGNSVGNDIAKEALALPQDDTALKEYRKKVLLGAADVLEEKVYSTEDGHLHSEYHAADELREMAEE
jgi:hypothetical protein